MVTGTLGPGVTGNRAGGGSTVVGRENAAGETGEALGASVDITAPADPDTDPDPDPDTKLVQYCRKSKLGMPPMLDAPG